jgi:hypothetical protein
MRMLGLDPKGRGSAVAGMDQGPVVEKKKVSVKYSNPEFEEKDRPSSMKSITFC